MRTRISLPNSVYDFLEEAISNNGFLLSRLNSLIHYKNWEPYICIPSDAVVNESHIQSYAFGGLLAPKYSFCDKYGKVFERITDSKKECAEEIIDVVNNYQNGFLIMES